jgi:hypothetical protein
MYRASFSSILLGQYFGRDVLQQTLITFPVYQYLREERGNVFFQFYIFIK